MKVLVIKSKYLYIKNCFYNNKRVFKNTLGKDGVIYSAINSCFVKICSLHGTSITTVEGLAPKDGQMHPIQVD